MERKRSGFGKRCTVRKDVDGNHYIIERAVYAAGAIIPCVDVWWNRQPRKKVDGRTVVEEHLVIRQESGEKDGADVIILTHGQIYDLLDALNMAVESK